ncbi:ubiquinol oxidase subunit II [Kerstersia gyiorum]|uniref:ubiquinol oxidase subunit II n=1 Tax=Kerstersia gyiorum TaxID=206506 RepID=UPI0039EBE85F
MKPLKIRHLCMLPALLALAGLSGCDWELINSKGQVGIEERNLIFTAVGLMLIVVLPAIILSLVFAWRYRASAKARYMPEWSHSTAVEVVVWGFPIIIICILSAVVWKSTHKLDPYRPLDSEVPPITVQAISADWKWIFLYPEQGVATVNELYIPANTPVAFEITSNSSMNTFFIPQLGGQIYAMGGMRTMLHLIANEPGDYRGFSGNYSGNGFSDMHFVAHALPPEQFEQWVQHTRAGSGDFDFERFLQVAKRPENPPYRYPIEQYASLEPKLFERIIGQFVDMSHHAAAPADGHGHAQDDAPSHDSLQGGHAAPETHPNAL